LRLVLPRIFKSLGLASTLLYVKERCVLLAVRMTLKIQRSEEDRYVVFTLSGRIQLEHLPELQNLFELEAVDHSIVLDMGEIRLVDRETVKFLTQCEADGVKLDHCPAYIREWMEKERSRT
jgi:hypothetical protein